MKHLIGSRVIKWGLVFVLLALILVILWVASYEKEPEAPFIYCPDWRDAPVKVPGLDHIVAIAYHAQWLTAIDAQGALWSYYPFPFKDCIGTAKRIYPGRNAGDEDPAVTRMGRITSSRRGGFGITVDGRLVEWNPELVNSACPYGTGAPGTCARVPPVVHGDIAAVSSTNEHLLAVDRRGLVWSEGMNDCGQLGRTGLYGGSPQRLGWGQVPGLPTVKAVATGARYSIALDRAGRVWAWGNNSHPDTDGDGQFHPSPTVELCHPGGKSPLGLDEAAHVSPEVVQGLPPVEAVNMYRSFALALDRKGMPWGWGYNRCHVIGPDTPEIRKQGSYHAEPQRITGMPRIVDMAPGYRHALFLDEEGGVWSTGLHCRSDVPTRVEALPVIVAVAAGRERSAVLDKEGHVWVWGSFP